MKMKTLFPAIAVAFVFLCAMSSRGDEASDHAELHLILTNYMDAVNSGDVSKIAPYLSTNVTGVMVTGEEVTGVDGLEAYWKKIKNLIGPGGNYHVNVKVDKTEFIGDAAISRGSTEDIVHLGSGKELPFNSLWTSVCRKEDGKWKVVRMQAAMNPIDNVFVSLRLQREKLLYAIGGFVVGFLLASGFQLFRRTLREPAKT